MRTLLNTVSHVPFFMEILTVVPRVSWRDILADYAARVA